MRGLFSGNNQPPSLLAGTLKIALAITAISCLTASYLSSRRLDQQDLSRLVAGITENLDPLTTGSIRESVDRVKIDPCVAPR
jgi:hypothetical protein